MMTFIRASLLAIIAVGLLSAPVHVLANVGPLHMFVGGGVVAPQSPHQSIRLESEEVIIRLKSSSYVVDVVFNLFNSGETTTEWIGFPKWVASRTGWYPTFMRFEGTVNGESIEFNEEWDVSGGRRLIRNLSPEQRMSLAIKPLKEERQWLVSRITFPGARMTTIRVTYEAPYANHGYREACYIYGTGSLWNGNIGKAVFIVDSTEVGGTRHISTNFEKWPGFEPVSDSVNSVPRQILKNLVRYELTDFKPHPEAFLRIMRKDWHDIKANYVRMKPVNGAVPMAPPPPMPAKVKK